MDVETLLTTTRTVRRKLDLDRAVPIEVIEDSLRIAQQAPAAGNLLSALRWVIVRDAGLRAKIAPIVRGAAATIMPQREQLTEEQNRVMNSARHLLDNLERVPVLAIPCLPGPPPQGHVYQTSYYGSAYPAIWSFQLALRIHGLGSSMCAYHLIDKEPEVSALLGIPSDVSQITMLAVAYTTQTDFQPAVRPPAEEITYIDSWNRRP
ncbi:nitroreductase family protein [Protofrankia symbiont of Coriaria ruscifolia]|uniref:Nitroreductase n=1 Tax=Candidatus Protofrankia californiensis TaxID=1839754 RepID=A0A1C3PGU0_9ACTN|nr:nitroreductase family protein [Protofrankia symbiont of Coriaria ruscifolia]SBW29047.1 nitroreductase [Candidatus Protofrankia californiensis]